MAKKRASWGKEPALWERYAEKQDGSDGWRRAQERCWRAGWAREVIGEMTGSMLGGRGEATDGRRIGEMNGLIFL